MNRIINKEQYDTFITLLNSDVDRCDEIIHIETQVERSEHMTDEDVDNIFKERDRLAGMIVDLTKGRKYHINLVKG